MACIQQSNKQDLEKLMISWYSQKEDKKLFLFYYRNKNSHTE